MKPSLLDLFAGAGGCSVGYERAGFEVVGVDLAPQRHYRGGTFVQADALEYVRDHGHEFDAIHASPPCQAHSALRALRRDKAYQDLIPATRAALVASGKPYVIENVVGAPLGGGDTYLLMLCGTMFGLVTPDGSAEIRRHRLFETNWCFGLQPACQHGEWTITVAGHDYHSMRARNARRVLCVAGGAPHDHAVRQQLQRARDRRRALSVVGNTPEVSASGHHRRVTLMVHGKSQGTSAHRSSAKRRAMSVTGNTPQTNTVRNKVRETFSVDDARAAMGIDWMPMRSLSQAIPPAYTEWIGRRLLAALAEAPEVVA